MFSQNLNDFGIESLLFHIRLQPDTQLEKQRNTKVPILYRDQMELILDDLEHEGTCERFRLNGARKIELASDFKYLIRILHNGDSYNIVIDARLFYAITDVSENHFRLIPVHVLISPTSGKTFIQTDLSTTYHQVSLTPETQKLLHFSSGNGQLKS